MAPKTIILTIDDRFQKAVGRIWSLATEHAELPDRGRRENLLAIAGKVDDPTPLRLPPSTGVVSRNTQCQLLHRL